MPLLPGRMHGTVIHSPRDDFLAHVRRVRYVSRLLYAAFQLSKRVGGKVLARSTSIRRSLTFNALDLNHSCFSKAKRGTVCERNNDNSDPESTLVEFEFLVDGIFRAKVQRVSPSVKEIPGWLLVQACQRPPSDATGH